MRNTILLSLLLLASVITATANPVIPDVQGTQLKYSVRDDRGQITGYVIKTVTAVETVSGGTRVTITAQMLDAEGKANEDIPAFPMTFMVTANNVTLGRGFMEGMIKQMAGGKMPEDIQFNIDGNDIVYPVIMSVGQNLTPYKFALSVSTEGFTQKIMEIETTERTVTGRETLSLEAGNFDCLVLTEKVRIKPAMGLVRHTHSETWCAEGVGDVMTVNYKKNGKVETVQKLISLTRP